MVPSGVFANSSSTVISATPSGGKIPINTGVGTGSETQGVKSKAVTTVIKILNENAKKLINLLEDTNILDADSAAALKKHSGI